MKRCSKCDETKSLDSFWHDSRGVPHSHCRACRNAATAAWRKANPEKVRAASAAYIKANPEKVRAATTDWRKANRLGFSLGEYERALALQGNRCAICRHDFGDLKTRHIHGDHDHTTGVARGVLCGSCNVGVGMLGDSVERLINAAWYLTNPTLTGRGLDVS